MKKNSDEKTIFDRIRNTNLLGLLLFMWTFFSATYVTYRMLLSDGITFRADYVDHLRMALENEGYSLMNIVFRVFHNSQNYNIYIALFMGMLVAFAGQAIVFVFNTVINIESIDDILFKEKIHDIIYILSYSFIFISAINIPQKSPFYMLSDSEGHYVVAGDTIVSSFMTQPWHNCTYIAMRLFGLLSVGLFARIVFRNEKTNVNYICLFITFLLANAFKPNFILAFAPTAFLICLIEFIKNRKIDFKRHLIIAVAIVISLFPLLYQYKAMYNVDSDSGLEITGRVISGLINSGYFKWEFICTYVYPILVTGVAIAKKKFNSAFAMAWIFDFITLLQRLLLLETGHRMMHANWIWNKPCSALVLFIICTAILIECSLDKDKLDNLKRIAWGILVIHLFNGFMYFGVIYMGLGYAH